MNDSLPNAVAAMSSAASTIKGVDFRMECLLATSHHSYENDIVLPVVPVELALNRKEIDTRRADRGEYRQVAELARHRGKRLLTPDVAR